MIFTLKLIIEAFMILLHFFLDVFGLKIRFQKKVKYPMTVPLTRC